MIEFSRTFSRDLIKAIARDARGYGDWQLMLHEHRREPGVPEWLRTWDGDGLLVRIHDEELAEFLKGVKYPVVNIAGACRNEAIPLIETDDHVVSEETLRFFLNRTFTNFAYCGYSGVWYSDLRERAFLDAVTHLGFDLKVYESSSERVICGMSQHEEFHSEGSPRLVEWLAGLPKETAILCCNDVRAFQVVASAAVAGRRIPEDLGVVGVGNEKVVAELCSIPLSSVRLDAEQMARTGCAWLNAMMTGAASAETVKALLPARGQNVSVVERASSDVIASQDATLVSALRYIRKHCHQPINGASVLDFVGKSRNTVESKLRSALGHTIADEILRCRIERAKVMIERTQIPIDQVALSCGFATAAHFSRRFKRATGLSPRAHRDIS